MCEVSSIELEPLSDSLSDPARSTKLRTEYLVPNEIWTSYSFSLFYWFSTTFWDSLDLFSTITLNIV